MTNEGSTSTQLQVSPPDNPQIHAQNIESGDSGDTSSPLFAAAFVDGDGNTEVLHISDYSDSSNPEAELVKRINQQLLMYDFSIGWYSTGVARYHEPKSTWMELIQTLPFYTIDV